MIVNPLIVIIYIIRLLLFVENYILLKAKIKTIINTIKLCKEWAHNHQKHLKQEEKLLEK